MSHIKNTETEIKSPEIVERTVAALGARGQLTGIKILGSGSHTIYGTNYSGFGIHLPDWRYPVVVNTDTGKLSYDNFNGSWGKQSHLDDFLQRYGIEAASAAAEARGFSYEEATLDNGDIRLRIHAGATGDAVPAGIGGPISF